MVHLDDTQCFNVEQFVDELDVPAQVRERADARSTPEGPRARFAAYTPGSA